MGTLGEGVRPPKAVGPYMGWLYMGARRGFGTPKGIWGHLGVMGTFGVLGIFKGGFGSPKGIWGHTGGDGGPWGGFGDP